MAYVLDCYAVSFWSNALLGVFGSSFLSFLIAVINYVNERKRTLENFLLDGSKVRTLYNKYPLNGNDEEKARLILQMAEFDYTSLDNAYGGVSFLIRHHYWQEKIWNEVYEPICRVRKAIAKCAKEIQRFSLLQNMDSATLSSCISEVDKVITKTTIYNVDGISMPEISNSIVEELDNKLNGFFYDLLYPWKRGKNHAD